MPTLPIAFIVEDDPRLSQLFSLTLKDHFEVHILNDGAWVLPQTVALHPAIVVLDLHLPGMSGAEILHAIRADSRIARTHVIVVTADALLAENIQDQADITLLKPVSPMQLRELALKLGKS